MDRDQSPTRDGYLKFKEAVKNGDKNLLRRAELDRQKDAENPRSVLAHYLESLRTEAAIDVKAVSADHRDEFWKNVAPQLNGIEDQQVHYNACRDIRGRLKAWDEERYLRHVGFCRTREAKISESIAARRAANPREPESEAAYWAECQVNGHYLGDLSRTESKLEHELDAIIHDAHDRDLRSIEERPGPSPDKSRIDRKFERLTEEKNPDRDGFSQFSEAVRNGDQNLIDRAEREWQKDPDHPLNTLACYFEMLCEEGLIDTYLRDDRSDHSRQKADERLANIKDRGIKRDASVQILERLKSWETERQQSQEVFRKTYGQQIRDGTLRRQAENPHEREGESWFWAKLQVDHDHGNELRTIEHSMLWGIEDIFTIAQERDARAIAEREAQAPEKSYFTRSADNAALDAFNREVEQRQAQEGFDKDGGIEF